VSANYAVSSEINVNATYSYFKYDVNEETVATGDKLLANTPKWRYNIAANYAGHTGFEAGLNWRSSAGFSWAAGVFAGWIEPGATLDANLGYKITNNFKVFLNGTNLANRQWFSIYGGSVTGRRVMGGVTATF
jgi:outer membrane receptor protein involved in Fe transport